MSDDARALARIGADGLNGLATVVEGIHLAIARRTPPVPGHDLIANVVYRSIKAGTAGAGLVAGAALRAAPPLTSTPRGIAATAALNAFHGDRLHAEGSPLALPMTATQDGPARRRVAVLVHGLGETERSWRRRAEVHEGTYAVRVLEELGFTPLRVRYNTGRAIHDNGRELSALVAETVARWSVPVDEVVLIGHSMGGLVARSAAHLREPWTVKLGAIVCLGSPHMGAPLEKLAARAAGALGRLPETAPSTSLFEARSQGIKDLHDGVGECPAPPGVALYGIAATLTRNPGHPVGRFAGDLLVREGSASGRCRKRGDLKFDEICTIGGLTHFDLLNHPEVDPHLRAWLAPPAPPAQWRTRRSQFFAARSLRSSSTVS
jgi:pimeloyl-ACP methyl ester carboxylesterase